MLEKCEIWPDFASVLRGGLSKVLKTSSAGWTNNVGRCAWSIYPVEETVVIVDMWKEKWLSLRDLQGKGALHREKKIGFSKSFHVKFFTGWNETEIIGRIEDKDRLNLIKISNTLFKNYFGKLEEIKSMINSSTSRVSLEEQKRRTDWITLENSIFRNFHFENFESR